MRKNPGPNNNKKTVLPKADLKNDACHHVTHAKLSFRKNPVSHPEDSHSAPTARCFGAGLEKLTGDFSEVPWGGGVLSAPK